MPPLDTGNKVRFYNTCGTLPASTKLPCSPTRAEDEIRLRKPTALIPIAGQEPCGAAAPLRLGIWVYVAGKDLQSGCSYSSSSESTGGAATPIAARDPAPNIGPRAGTTGANPINPIFGTMSS